MCIELQYKTTYPWIPSKDIDWSIICENPKAIHIIEFCLAPDTIKTDAEAQMFNSSKINWIQLSQNTAAIHLLEANPDKIIWKHLSMNPNAMHLLLPLIKGIDAEKELKELYSKQIDWPYNANYSHCGIDSYDSKRDKNMKKIDMDNFMLNPAAIPLLLKYPELIRWHSIMFNHYGYHIYHEYDRNSTHFKCMAMNAWDIIQLRQDEPESWEQFCDTFSAYSDDLRVLNFLYEEDFISWMDLCENPSPAAITILADNYDHPQICWARLSANPGAIDILKAHPERIDDCFIWDNPNIFTYDYQLIKKHREPIKEALMQYLYHPNRIQKVIEHADDQDLQVLDSYLP